MNGNDGAPNGSQLRRRDNFVQIALRAKLQRANFLRENPRIVFVMAGSIGLIFLGLVLIPAINSQTTIEAVAQIESQSVKRTMEATGQIERLAAILERMNAIGPDPAREIMQLIRQPIYDCDQVACSTELQRRNHLALSKIKVLLATKALRDENSTNYTLRPRTRLNGR